MPELISSAISTPKGIVDFQFDKMPVSDDLYAVYCKYEERDYCFHMMYDTTTLEFKIVDRRNCPYELHELSYLLSRAIEQNHA